MATGRDLSDADREPRIDLCHCDPSVSRSSIGYHLPALEVLIAGFYPADVLVYKVRRGFVQGRFRSYF
jgi:hypothetical protein